jgi:hypothetical protein
MMTRKVAVLSLALAPYVHSFAAAEDKPKDKIAQSPEHGQPVVQISPIFNQLLLLSFPSGFKAVFEQTNGSRTGYIRESVLEGETGDQWSEMITVTGAKGLAANPNVTPQLFVGQIAAGFNRACPETFSSKELSAAKISGQDATALVASCGTVQSGNTKRSESALLIAIKGSADYYTIQWAERGPASGRPVALSDEKWADRFRRLNPIKVCPRIPGEREPYPSCLSQK